MWKRLLTSLRHAGSPRRTAAAFALGVFLSFSPFLGLQTVLGFSAAFAFRLSRVAMFAGLCTNLPWLMLPWYTLTTAAAAYVLEAPVSADPGPAMSKLFELPLTGPAFWTQALEILAPFLWSFFFGSTAGALVVSAVAYVAVSRYMTRAARLEPLPDGPAEPEPSIAPADTAR
ncbi:MAG TPA: DUF2062 domain-containing protein [Vicinamibacterales bacterium]|nr:DUF2062 domain-containing protein [Vicinamibacterales bacterium]